MRVPASDHFILSVTEAMRTQLSRLMDGLDPDPLSEDAVDRLERLPGVYELLQSDGDDRRIVYVGKADLLPERLKEHIWKIESRENISLSDMSFVCAYVAKDLNAIAPEKMLIGHRRRVGDATWNGGDGFGPHDPGRKRDTQDPPPWDVRHPIRTNVPVGIAPGDYDLLDFLWKLKEALPFVFRFQRENKRQGSGDPDYVNLKVTVPREGMTALDLLALPALVLPRGWRVTVLPGYAIMYKDSKSSPVTLHVFEANGS